MCRANFQARVLGGKSGAHLRHHVGHAAPINRLKHKAHNYRSLGLSSSPSSSFLLAAEIKVAEWQRVEWIRADLKGLKRRAAPGVVAKHAGGFS